MFVRNNTHDELGQCNSDVPTHETLIFYIYRYVGVVLYVDY